jgi:hypothetical protein
MATDREFNLAVAEALIASRLREWMGDPADETHAFVWALAHDNEVWKMFVSTVESERQRIMADHME